MHKHKDSKRYNRPIGVKEGTKLEGRYVNIMNRFCKVHFISSDTRHMCSHFTHAQRLIQVQTSDIVERHNCSFSVLANTADFALTVTDAVFLVVYKKSDKQQNDPFLTSLCVGHSEGYCSLSVCVCYSGG